MDFNHKSDCHDSNSFSFRNSRTACGKNLFIQLRFPRYWTKKNIVIAMKTRTRHVGIVIGLHNSILSFKRTARFLINEYVV